VPPAALAITAGNRELSFKMSADAESESSNVMMMCCASCGIGDDDDIKLKKCTACKLVRYCSVKCQREHRPQHKKTCKKWAVESRDELLFKQPESSHRRDCPICFLPLPLDLSKSVQRACCSKVVCNGCEYTNVIREREEKLKHTCPFCRHPTPKSQAEAGMTAKNRIEANDPTAVRNMGTRRYREGDYKSAFEHFSKAVELGDVEAHYFLSNLYLAGLGVEKDKKLLLHHLEEASIGGHPFARHNLAKYEEDNGRLDRAIKHWIIAANLGFDRSMDALKSCYTEGSVSKEDFAAAFRAHQVATDAMKSPQREAASTQKARKLITAKA